MKIEGPIAKTARFGKAAGLTVANTTVFVYRDVFETLAALQPDVYVKIEAEENERGKLEATAVEIVAYDVMVTRGLHVEKPGAEQVAQHLQRRGFCVLLHPARLTDHNRAFEWATARNIDYVIHIEVVSDYIKLLEFVSSNEYIDSLSVDGAAECLMAKQPPRSQNGFLQHATLATQQERDYVARVQQGSWRPRRTT